MRVQPPPPALIKDLHGNGQTLSTGLAPRAAVSARFMLHRGGGMANGARAGPGRPTGGAEQALPKVFPATRFVGQVFGKGIACIMAWIG